MIGPTVIPVVLYGTSTPITFEVTGTTVPIGRMDVLYGTSTPINFEVMGSTVPVGRLDVLYGTTTLTGADSTGPTDAPFNRLDA